ncbi:MAG: UDP-N-acetylglucosamine 2-epimerase [Patescibacteria group bacterium]|mgnify:CR=1 FL=1
MGSLAPPKLLGDLTCLPSDGLLTIMNSQRSRRRICFVITSLIHYSRNMLVLDELKRRKDVELHVAIGGTTLISRYTSKYGAVRHILERERFGNVHEVHFNLEGDVPIVKAKTAGLGIIEFSTLFNNIKPDLVVVRGDRFEVLAAVIAAAFSNIPIAHIEGGDVSGTIDESVRHAITKFSHIHFPTNGESQKRILRMGEHPDYVFNYGSPDVEVVHKITSPSKNFDMKKTGSGADIDLGREYLMVMYHPVVTELDQVLKNITSLLRAIHGLGMQTLWFWPNADLGSEIISRELRAFNDNEKGHAIRFMRDINPQEFIWLLRNSRCLVGNSSAGIKECSYLGIPVVNVGSRQNGRLRAHNVLNVHHDEGAIRRAIDKQLRIKRYPPSNLYLAKNTSKNIAKTLATVGLYVQKNFV